MSNEVRDEPSRLKRKTGWYWWATWILSPVAVCGLLFVLSLFSPLVRGWMPMFVQELADKVASSLGSP